MKEEKKMLYCCICLAAGALRTAPPPPSQLPTDENLEIRGHNQKPTNIKPLPYSEPWSFY